jgi:hypothetical protein
LRSTSQRPERRYAGFNSPIPAVAAAEAQAMAITSAGGKDVAGGEADAVLQRLVEQGVAVDRLWKLKPWLFGDFLMNSIGGRSSRYQLAGISIRSVRNRR